MTAQKDSDGQIQGEGDYRSARRYDEAQKKFVDSGQVDDAARKAKPGNAAEAQEMQRAEEAGKSHAKGEDPAIKRDCESPRDSSSGRR